MSTLFEAVALTAPPDVPKNWPKLAAMSAVRRLETLGMFYTLRQVVRGVVTTRMLHEPFEAPGGKKAAARADESCAELTQRVITACTSSELPAATKAALDVHTALDDLAAACDEARSLGSDAHDAAVLTVAHAPGSVALLAFAASPAFCAHRMATAPLGSSWLPAVLDGTTTVAWARTCVHVDTGALRCLRLQLLVSDQIPS